MGLMQWALMATLAGMLAGCGGNAGATAPAAGEPATRTATTRGPAMTIEQIEANAKKLEPLFAKLGKPKPGEWLASHPEPGQTFEEYRQSDPNRPTAVRTTICLQPLGAFTKPQQALIDDTAAMMSLFYGVPVKQLKAVGLEAVPAGAKRIHPTWGDRQILTGWVLGYLQKNARPGDTVATLALTTSDLWPGEGWNFVFGEASLDQRVGVWSLYRYGNPEKDYTTTLRRTLKVAIHETGHMLGIYHCTFYECGMNGSNHLQEMDERPMAFCPVDEAKVWWACGLSPQPRYDQLAAWAQQHKLAEEAKLWRQASAALK